MTTFSTLLQDLLRLEKQTKRAMAQALATADENGADLRLSEVDESILKEMLECDASNRTRARSILHRLAKKNPKRYKKVLDEVITEDVFAL